MTIEIGSILGDVLVFMSTIIGLVLVFYPIFRS